MFKRFQRNSTFVQFYATIFWDTCEECLQLHGRIFDDGQAPEPPLHEGCRCSVLSFSNSELKYYREHAKRMEEKAKAELERRQWLVHARQRLADTPEESFACFERAAQMELYPEEVELLFEYQGHLLQDNFDLSRRLFKLFIKANRYRYDLSKYHHMPPKMQQARIADGERVIRGLFKEWLPELNQEHP